MMFSKEYAYAYRKRGLLRALRAITYRDSVAFFENKCTGGDKGKSSKSDKSDQNMVFSNCICSQEVTA